MSIQGEAFRKFIGKPAKDIYGRYLGYVVGLTLDLSGKLHSVGVGCGGRFEEFSQLQISIKDDNVVITPRWKIEAERFRKEFQLTYSRFRALEELLKNKEIPDYVYEELCREYKETMSKLENGQKEISLGLSERMEELDKNIRNLERFLGYLKVQRRTGELSEEAYRIASEHILSEIEKAFKEKEDVKKCLESISPMEEEPAKPEPPIGEEQMYLPKVQAEKKSEEQKPFTVRLQPDS
ncbi:MAG: CdvA-like protein [Candidatus Bathyarchaeota archaeon]|nr:CdvA-like protein [Candidatus Bathyarchaeota archaeon]